VDARAWDERYEERELVWSAEPNVFVAREVAGLPPGRALDLAAGEGRNAIWLAEQGYDVEAVEFSPVAIDKGRAIAARRGVRVRWTLADLTDTPALVPAVLVVLAYLQLPREQLASIHRWAAGLVAPGGTLLVVAHARANLERGVGGPPDPALCPTVDEVLADLDGSGLLVQASAEVDREVVTDQGPRVAVDVLVRAHRPAGY